MQGNIFLNGKVVNGRSISFTEDGVVVDNGDTVTFKETEDGKYVAKNKNNDNEVFEVKYIQGKDKLGILVAGVVGIMTGFVVGYIMGVKEKD